jgi:hypothetical protein
MGTIYPISLHSLDFATEPVRLPFEISFIHRTNPHYGASSYGGHDVAGPAGYPFSAILSRVKRHAQFSHNLNPSAILPWSAAFPHKRPLDCDTIVGRSRSINGLCTPIDIMQKRYPHR